MFAMLTGDRLAKCLHHRGVNVWQQHRLCHLGGLGEDTIWVLDVNMKDVSFSRFRLMLHQCRRLELFF